MKREAVLWFIFDTVLVLSMLLGCATPTPTPDPGPGPVDAAPAYPFDGMIADCDADSAQSPSVLSPVNSCLSGSNPVDSCMVDLLTTWPPDAIACGVRRLGIMAAISVAGGDAGASDRSVAPSARSWIRGHRIEFRN